ncbi:GNAT family N-acetyltransferase [Roseibaca sp. Y0-43]|uniref:GNAT family N-acetyltransferase n=1 Tax=Roseibaca sp. Y0-43 TaxID=2816854 RepID=UPI001D0C5F0D|nr:GNAT family N-acetyltransferase [Roseibaca sp. Y0-43]MCC1482011.1 GNAT family N-acetyltransferase [Roseibaca sp. Y0-43]
MTLDIRITHPNVPEVAALIRSHAGYCEAVTPAGSCHYFTGAKLDDPSVTLWGAWRGDSLLGIGALQRLSDMAGEVKSMHTLATARGAGVGRALLQAIIAKAHEIGLSSLSLETGSNAAFAPARALYERFGFVTCPPFGSYTEDANSTYYTLALAKD